MPVDYIRIALIEQITAAFVVDPSDWVRPRRPVGIVHLHDLLPYGLS